MREGVRESHFGISGIKQSVGDLDDLPGSPVVLALRILGPLRLDGPDGEVVIGGEKPRRLLGALALYANEVVSADRLIDVIWAQSPPRSARENLQTYMWSLRRAVKTARSPGLALESRPPGYVLRIEPEALDWLHFGQLAEAGAKQLAVDPAAASRLLREALACWRGVPLADIAGELGTLQPRITAMEDARLDALELRVEADLATGGHRELVGELAELVVEHPLREQFRAHQMLALYRSERQADALAAFRQHRELLAEELGIVPGPALQRLHEAILRNDPALDLPARGRSTRAAGPAAQVPRQLPARPHGFTGRSEYLRRLTDASAAVPGSPATVALAGPPGVGKTALALHWAHSAQDRFPDGTLFADLRGFDAISPPADPGEVLDGFLRALGVDLARIPAALDERAALFRTTLASKRMLIVLDNAAESEQARPLLPGAAGCLALVTSRTRLSSLAVREGAVRIAVAPLSGEEATAVLRRFSGQLGTAEPAAAAEVSRLCGGLPLALRIAAERVAANPHLGLSGLARLLAGERGRLAALATDDGDVAIRAAFGPSYRALAPSAARMFRLCGLHPTREFSVSAAAAVADTNEAGARRLLDELTASHLVEATAPGRLRMHDLLAAYAGELTTGPAGADANRRLLRWYLHTADAADHLLIPQRPRPCIGPVPGSCRPLEFEGYDAALAWCEQERVNLVAATRQALAAGELEFAWQIPAALGNYLKLTRRWDDWISTHMTGLEAARRLADRGAEAWLLSSLGGAYGDLRDFSRSASCFREALEIRRKAQDLKGQAATLLNLGFLHWKQQRTEDGIECFLRSLELSRQTGERYAEAMALNNLGEAYQQLGRFQEALDHLRRALAIFRSAGDMYNHAMTLDSVGRAHRGLGNFDDALRLSDEALLLRRQAGDRQGEALTLAGMAETFLARGDAAPASRHWLLALAIFDELGDPEADEIRRRMHAAEQAL